MAFSGVGARLLAGAHPVGDVPPVIGGNVMWLDADGFHRVDVAKHLFDLGPSLDLQQNVAARLRAAFVASSRAAVTTSKVASTVHDPAR